MVRKFPGGFFGLFLALVLVTPAVFHAQAQGGMQVNLYGLQTGAFPTISGGMDVYDANGDFLTGLQVQDVILLEDDRSLELDALDELNPGARLVVAINTGPAFGRRDAYAVTRLDLLRTTLAQWAGSSAGQQDDLSLIAVGASDVTHTDLAGFQAAVSAYRPDARALAPSFDTLSRAIDLAAAEDPQSGEKGAVLFISSLPEAEVFSLLEGLTARAVQMNVRVHVWIIADESKFTLAGATALKDVAIQTHGQYFAFSGRESLPSPESYAAPLRHAYAFRYTSVITSSGSHELTVTVAKAGAEAGSSSPYSFDLEVAPPNPILVSPPDQVLRQPPDDETTDLLAYVPADQKIEMLVEFPDSHTRALERTVLYVDGQMVDENLSAPFEYFTWDLTGYVTSGEHMLQVEAEDSLGLSQVSLGVPVTVTVLQQQNTLLVAMKRNAIWLALGAVGLLGAGLVVVLTTGKFGKLGGRRIKARRDMDPVTQPIPSGAADGRRNLVWTKVIKPASAYLVRLRLDGQEVAASPIPLYNDEITFGNDPTRVTNLLDDPSIAPLHARLVRTEENEYFLSDENSSAGTWVDYEPLTAARQLKHGDIIHIGRISYRFMLRNPPKKDPPQVMKEKR